MIIDTKKNRPRAAALASAALGAVLLLAGCASPVPAGVPEAAAQEPADGGLAPADDARAGDVPARPRASRADAAPQPFLAGPTPELAPDPPPAEARSVAPALPDGVAADEAGAVEALRHALDVLAHVSFTGDLAPWESLADPACTGCTELATAIRAQHAEGTRTAGPFPQRIGTPEVTTAGDGAWRVELLARIPETREISADDATRHREAYRLDVGALVAHDDGAWVLRELEVTELPVE